MAIMATEPSPAAASTTTADFLRRLSVADAKVLLERTRQEKARKTQEMHSMIGVRYRDLIESADRIVSMHSAALALEGSLREMPGAWTRAEAALAASLADAARLASGARAAADERPAAAAEGDAAPQDASVAHVRTLAEAPERMWQLLDRGECFGALQALRAAETARAQLGAPDAFPFLPALWSCIQSFRPRMSSRARAFLTCRGRDSAFYAQNLCALAVLAEPRLTAEQLFQAHLDARSKWMAGVTASAASKAETKSLAEQARDLAVAVRAVNLTIAQTEQIFSAEDAFAAFSAAFELAPALEAELQQFVASGSLHRRMTEWFVDEHRKIDAVVSRTISRIPSIGLLAKVQSKLSRANLTDGGCVGSKLWPAIASALPSATRSPHDASPFSTLFADAFRKRTRDLVQHSFVEALEAIKKQIRQVVSDSSRESSSRLSARLGSVQFYDYFEMIHRKASDLDASDLQAVLVEEFLRTLLKLVLFFESEYPLDTTESAQARATSAGAERGSSDENKFLCISNILSAVLAGFPERSAKLFPNMASASLSDTSTFSRARSAFEAHAHDGRMTHAALNVVLQTIQHEGNGAATPSFIDSELSSLHTLGPHSFFLVLEIKRQRAGYPQAFVSVVRELSREYCELWARSHLSRKIEPLRERIRMEQYEASNEEWIATHEGWVQQLITEDSLGSDLDDSASETEVFGEEKVWLPWCETTTVSSFLFQCCYMLDEANRLVRSSEAADEKQVALMHGTIRDVLVEQLTIISVDAYEEGVALLVRAKANQRKQSVLNFGECCILQFLFDMYFVRATLGFSDFIRFGWGDELNEDECSPGLVRLKKLFEKMQDFVDPVDWEIYGPQLVENVVIQFRKSRLLFSSLSEANDINDINGKQVSASAHDTRPLVRIAEPVARFSLLPVPSSHRRLQRKPSPTPGRLESVQTRSLSSSLANKSTAASSASLFQEPRVGGAAAAAMSAESNSSASLKLQSILSGSAGTNLLSSAAKGMSFISSATSSYLREGESSSKSSRYF